MPHHFRSLRRRASLLLAGTARTALAALTAIAALAAVPAARAQTAPYPSKPIRLVVPYPPGGQSDIVGRAIAQPLSEALGQPVVVDNRVGASGMIGHELVAKAAPDGYTLLVGNSAMLAVAVSMISDLPYDPLKDFAPIIRVGGGAYVLEVNPRLPVHSVADLLALARRDPGRLNIGIGGLGSLPHLLSAQVQKVAGVQWTTVNYKGGGPALLDLLGGQIELTIDNVSSSAEYIKAGRLRPLAVSSKTELLPGLPTFEEAGLRGVSATSWHGILAPARTPAAIVQRVNAALESALRQSALQQRLRALGIDVAGGSAEDFATFIRAENQRWASVVRQTGARID
ncbi:MAG TPA: tripartite tricarboxylate transporter substrate binding protein [Pseudorhodoferax sp.]|jgi:tripartite-type tricarboxylate transporter receptor subunit TctC|nr:tripartite tricarboxylate transporter substrate binding protein [Pseudorhodoferax sp.]